MPKISQYDTGTPVEGDFIPYTDSSENTTKKANFSAFENIVKNRTITTVWFTKCDYVCDGTADNVQIQQAIDAVTVNWGIIVLQPGTYNLSAALVLKSNITFIGSGEKTILKWSTGIGGIFYQWGSTVPYNSVLRDFVIDCNNVSNISWMQIYKFNTLTIENVTIKNVNGIWGAKLWDYGSWVSDKSYNLTLNDFKLTNANCNTYEPLITVNTRNITIQNIYVASSDLVNASMVSIFLLSENVKINGAYIENSTDDYWLLDVTGTSEVTITWSNFVHRGTTWNNCIVARNNKNLNITGNVFKWITWSGAGWSAVQVIDWSGTIDGHTNPNSYTEDITISSNTIEWFYYGVSFANADSSTNTGWKNINIVWNTIIGFDYAAITARHVSGRDSANWNITGNIIVPRTAWDKVLVWFRDTTYKPTNVLIDGNIFRSTTSNNTTVYSFDSWDIIKFGTNINESRGTWVEYSMGTATNITYPPVSSAAVVYNSTTYYSGGAWVWTIFTFDSELFDTDWYHSTSSNTSRLTAPRSGNFEICYNATFSVATAWSQVICYIWKNWGTAIAKAVIDNPNASSNKYMAINVKWFDTATAWDYYEVRFYSSAGSNNVTIWGWVNEASFSIKQTTK